MGEFRWEMLLPIFICEQKQIVVVLGGTLSWDWSRE